MDVQMETLMKQIADMQGLLATLTKKEEPKDGIVHTDAIKKDELEKMKVDILNDIDKRLAESKKPNDKGNGGEKEKLNIGKYLLAIKTNDQEYLKTYMSEGDNAQGGYTVPTGQDTEMYGILNDPATVIAKCTRYPHGKMDGFTKNIPKWLTDLTVAWINEATAKSTTKPTVEQKQSVLRKMYAMIPFTDEYLADNVVNITQQISRLVGENFNVEMERSVLAGNTDPFVGVGYDVGVTTAAQAGGNLGYPDLLTIVNNANLEKYHIGAEMYMRRAVLSLIMGLVDGNARPLWNMNSINGKMTNTVLGVPINLSSQTVATQILYGNFKNVLIGYKSGGAGAGIQVTISNTAVDGDTTNYWTQDMTGYRFVMRRSVLVVNPEAFFNLTGVA